MKRWIIAVMLCAGSVAHAGDRPFELTLVNMTPDALSTKAGSKCAIGIVYTIKRTAEVDLKKIGETKLRKLTGIAKDGPHFMGWEAEKFKAVGKKYPGDAVILVDCQPENNKMDVLVVTHESGQATRFRIRHTVNAGVQRAVTARILSVLWGDFNP